MPSRWARSALCTLAVGASALFATLGGTAGGASAASLARGPAGHVPTSAPLLSLNSQTPWVTASAPGFNLSLGVSAAAGSASDLHVSLTFYSRIGNPSQLQQAIGGTPPTVALLHVPDVPVAAPATPSGAALTADACVTVLPEPGATAPSGEPGACPVGSPTFFLDCTPGSGRCGNVYPVVVSLLATGNATPLARLTTFVTYQEPDAVGQGGPLRVGVVLPVTGAGAAKEATALTAHRGVATTLAVSPTGLAAVEPTHSRQDLHPYEELAGLGDEIVDEPYVPVNLAAMSGAGIADEIGVQLGRGGELLRAAGLKPTPGLWVDTDAALSQSDTSNLASGLQGAGANQLVLSDTDLSTAGLGSPYTFAQPFTLDLGRGSTVSAAATDSTLSTLFSSQPNDPVLGAEQLVAGLSFVHFENAYLSQPRGVVVVPPPHWQPSAAFLDALLAGLSDNPALEPVTVAQLIDRVPAGGNGEPVVRHLQAGAAGGGITRSAAVRIANDRQQLSSFVSATGPAPELSTLADQLLGTEAQGLSSARRNGALNAYARAFGAATGQITLATEGTVTFTARQADIPVTVLSAAPYPITVVVTLTSDKFLFPHGNTRQLTLDRPTTSVRVTAEARTSGDRLPIEVTLQTPDGQLLIAHAVLTVHSTSISFVGVALTGVAGAVLLVWWVRTWRRSRRQRPRSHPRAA